MKTHGVRLALALVLVACALAVPVPARAICPAQWACYDGCSLSASDCYSFGGGDECGEQFAYCYSICDSFTC
jgi:hypothetical protein